MFGTVYFVMKIENVCVCRKKGGAIYCTIRFFSYLCNVNIKQ